MEREKRKKEGGEERERRERTCKESKKRRERGVLLFHAYSK